MKRRMLKTLVSLLTIYSSAYALDTANLVNDTSALALLKEKCISTETSGVVPVRFDIACSILSKPDLYQMVQDEYASSVSKDGTVDFPIITTKPGHYYYINRENQRTDIVELYRQQTETGVFDVILMASGKRFFGTYDVLIHVQVLDAATAGVAYVADVHAFPHNGTMRFIARRFGVVERYFKKNTNEIQWLAKKLGTGLSNKFSEEQEATPFNVMGITALSSRKSMEEVDIIGNDT